MLYKAENNTLMYAESKVSYPDGVTLIVADYENVDGEIYDGWFWFNTSDEAKAALGVTDPEILNVETFILNEYESN